MASQTDTAKQIIARCVISILLLYIFFIPICYVVINNYEPSLWFIEIIVYCIRFLCIFPIALMIRKKYNASLSSTAIQSKSYCKIFLVLIAIYLWLYLFSVPGDLYFTITASLDIYSLKTTNLLFVLAFEQFFGKYMFFNMIFCCMLVFFQKTTFKVFQKRLCKTGGNN